MVTVNYTSKGNSISDFELDEFVLDVEMSIALHEVKEFRVSSSVAIDALRLAILEGRIDQMSISFKIENVTTEMDDIAEFPLSVMEDVHARLSAKIIKLQVERILKRANAKIHMGNTRRN
jgi:hypothetical protein